jgi:hypothetical protein
MQVPTEPPSGMSQIAGDQHSALEVHEVAHAEPLQRYFPQLVGVPEAQLPCPSQSSAAVAELEEVTASSVHAAAAQLVVAGA